ncbi:MAG: phage holin family protein, partial [Aliifodinibius sp.]|nr:phage holin family protein [Fodinibius sp.]NIV12301.1 phage holin family protein [Fodinibius sp.]NIW97230.1 phage holin family protein [Phycisphaerae bacterium]NIY25960.1 phage holin family protein [Fodinibius sp.]
INVFTLGLFILIINTFMFYLTGYIGTQFGIGFTVEGFWPAFLGALIVSIIGMVFGVIVPDRRFGKK